jgi:tetratricopeptide (TPR) repeat protein
MTGHRLAGQWLHDQGETDAVVLAEHFAGGGAADQAVEWFERAARQALAGGETGADGAPRAAEPGAAQPDADPMAALRKAATYYRRAGETSMESYANDNAIVFFERAAALWATFDPVEAARTRLKLASVREHVGQMEEALSDLDRALTETPADDARLRVSILLLRAAIAMRGEGANALDGARQLAHEAREVASKTGAREQEAQALTVLASILERYDTEEHSSKAVQYAEFALSLRREQGNIGPSLWRLGNAFLLRNDLTRAEGLYRDAVAVASASNDDVLVANCLGNLGLIAFRRWNLREAIDQSSRALDIYHRVGHRARTTAVMINLGTFHHMQGETLLARPLLEEALSAARGDWILTTLCQETLAEIERQEGNEAAAQHLLRAAALLCERVDVPQKESFYLGLLAESHWAAGDPDLAIKCLETAAEVGDDLTLSHALVMSHLGNRRDAQQGLERFQREDPDPDRRLIAKLALSRLLWWQRRHGDALDLCRDCLKLVAPAGSWRFSGPARVLEACILENPAGALSAYREAVVHCPRSAREEMALDVATLLVDAFRAVAREEVEDFLTSTGDTNDWGIRYRLETLRAALLRDLGCDRDADAAFARASSDIRTLASRLPPEHCQTFEQHPWVQEVRSPRFIG